jgi:Transglycosylase SLT domain
MSAATTSYLANNGLGGNGLPSTTSNGSTVPSTGINASTGQGSSNTGIPAVDAYLNQTEAGAAFAPPQTLQQAVVPTAAQAQAANPYAGYSIQQMLALTPAQQSQLSPAQQQQLETDTNPSGSQSSPGGFKGGSVRDIALQKRAEGGPADSGPIDDGDFDLDDAPSPYGGGMSAAPDPLKQAIHNNESGGSMRPGIIGDNGSAFGPMQVHAGALADVNKKLGTNYKVTDMVDNPDIGKKVGDTYLDMMHDRYGDDRLAAAAYNSGPARVDQALAMLPSSTQNYVKKATGMSPAHVANDDRSYQMAAGDSSSPGGGMKPADVQQASSTSTNDHAGRFQPTKPDPWLALAAAGFGMAAGKSPHALENVGSGALKGLENYGQQKQNYAKESEEQSRLDQSQKQIDQTSKYQTGELGLRQQQNLQTAKSEADHIALEQQQLKQQDAWHNESMVPADVREAQWYQNATPEQRQAYDRLQFQKKGMTDLFGNPNPSSVTPPPGVTAQNGNPQSAQNGSQQSAGVHGDDYLKTLNPNAANMVKAIAEGRMPMPSRPTPQQQQLIMAAGQYDPTFDATDYNKRNRTATDFSPAGQSGKAVTAINTAMDHVDVLDQRLTQLGNGNIPTVNAIDNWWKENVTGSSAPNNAAQARDAVSNELRKVFATTGGGGLEELREWEKTFPINGSPKQQQDSVRGAITLMDSRLSSLANSYSVGMGVNHNGTDLLSPSAQKSYQRLMGQEPTSGQPVPPKFKNTSVPDGGNGTPSDSGARDRSQPAPASARSGSSNQTAAIPKMPSGLPVGSAYSQSRQQWRTPSGVIFDLNGRQVGAPVDPSSLVPTNG